MAEPGGTRALENSGNYTTERGGNDRAEMGWKLTTARNQGGLKTGSGRKKQVESAVKEITLTNSCGT